MYVMSFFRALPTVEILPPINGVDSQSPAISPDDTIAQDTQVPVERRVKVRAY